VSVTVQEKKMGEEDKEYWQGMAWLGGTWEGGCSDDYLPLLVMHCMMFGVLTMAGYI
jgi:hypothetical protein